MPERVFHIYRGKEGNGELREYTVPVGEGMVILDALHWIQAKQEPDLAVRWNCKAGRCGSCSAEVNGKPGLTCMTRIDRFPEDEPITVTPLKAFPVVKDLVTDVSWNYERNKEIPRFTPRAPDRADGTWRMQQYEVDRAQEFKKCIECFLCQDVCHVLRNHGKHDQFMGPAFLVRAAAFEMHPLDVQDRAAYLREDGGVGYCNITKCCTDVCPEGIRITDNAIIPLKERVVDRHFDPLTKLVQLVRRRKK